MRFIFHAAVLARIINLAFLARNRHLARLLARNNKTLQVLLEDFHHFLARSARKQTFYVDVLQDLDLQEILKITSKNMGSCLHDPCKNRGRTYKMV